MATLTSFVPSRTLVAAAATSLLCAAGAIAQTPATPVISVYYDQAHGEAPPPPPMAELGSRGGYTAHVGTGPIDVHGVAGVWAIAPAAHSSDVAAAATTVRDGTKEVRVDMPRRFLTRHAVVRRFVASRSLGW